MAEEGHALEDAVVGDDPAAGTAQQRDRCQSLRRLLVELLTVDEHCKDAVWAIAAPATTVGARESVSGRTHVVLR